MELRYVRQNPEGPESGRSFGGAAAGGAQRGEQGGRLEPAQGDRLEPVQTDGLEPAQGNRLEPVHTDGLEAAQTGRLEPAQTDGLEPVDGGLEAGRNLEDGDRKDSPVPDAHHVGEHVEEGGQVDPGQPASLQQQQGWSPIKLISLEGENIRRKVDWSKPQVDPEADHPKAPSNPGKKAIRERWTLKK